MKIKYRYYQEEANEAIKRDLHLPGNSLVVVPTAGGKSHIIAATSTLVKKVLILQPTQELLKQNYEKLSLLVDEEDIGIYCASFNRREVRRFTFATIQSIHTKPTLFKDTELVVLDECHGLAPRTQTNMYKKFLKAIGNPKVIGFTATPYRTEMGYYKDEKGVLMAATMIKLLNRMRNKSEDSCFWKKIIYNVSHEKLLSEGYLSPIEYIYKPLMDYSVIPINKSYSDYNLEAYGQSVVGREAEILSTIKEAQKRYKSVLVFCSTTEQARHFSNVMVGSKTVFGDTPTKEREETIQAFKEGTLKTVFNVGTLTTGFDHPALDCIILLRPTRSIVLYNQIIGRLTRIAPGKDKGTIIDLTDTCKAIGRVETFKLYKNERGLWDLKTEKHDSWHDRVLFRMPVEEKE